MNDFCENTDLKMIEDDGVNTPYYQPSEDKVVVLTGIVIWMKKLFSRILFMK